MIKGEITKKLSLVLLILATSLSTKVFAATDISNGVYLTPSQTDFSVNEDIKFSIESSEKFINELNAATFAIESTVSVEYIDTGSGVQLPPPPVVSSKPEIYVEAPNGDKLDIAEIYTDKLSDGTQNNLTNSLVYIPKEELTIPGTYTIKIISEGQTLSQDFTWGVLALNSNKSLYTLGDTAKLSMAVLDELGNMVCDAKLTLTISKDFKQVSKLTTDNGIKVNKECNLHGFTLTPDYESQFKPLEVGEYALTLEATTKNKTYTIHDTFSVEKAPDFDIERVTATRLYPVEKYPVEIKIKANKDFTGTVFERVPSTFAIYESQEGLTFNNITEDGSSRVLSWDISLLRGESITAAYTFDPPDISPEIFLLGKLELVTTDNLSEFTESRFWQLANDSVGHAKATRAYTSGFELNSTTAGMEYDTNINSPAISAVTYRSGSYALNTAVSGADSTEGITIQFIDADSTVAWVSRAYIRIASYPNTETDIMQYQTISGTNRVTIKMTTSGELKLYSDQVGAQIGSSSSALSLNTWYRLELWGDNAAAGNAEMGLRLDGVMVASTTTGTMASFGVLRLGILSSAQADLFWDDIAINTDAFTGQDNWPGEGKVVYLRPNGNGASTAWTGDYTAVDEITPNDATDYINCTTDGGGQTETYNYQDTTDVGIGSGDQIRLMEGWMRTSSASPAAARVHSLTLVDTIGGGSDASASISVNSLTWYTDDDTLPRGSSVVSYDIQGSSYNPLTSGVVDGIQTSLSSTTDCAPDIYVTAIWIVVEYVPEGGRLFTSGFELQSTTAGVEWSSVTGTIATDTSVKRAGAASLIVGSLGNTTEESVGYNFTASGVNTNGPFYFRAYIYITTAPGSANRIYEVKNSSGTAIAYMTLDNSRLLRLYDEDGQVGSASTALSTSTWYRIEMQIDASGAGSTDTVEGKIDGGIFATSSTRNLSTGVRSFLVGGNMNGEANTTGLWYFDDCAINMNSGTVQNSYPGYGKVAHLRPDGVGSYGTSWTGNNTGVDEITPNDGTDNVNETTIQDLESFTLDATATPGIPANTNISFAAVGFRFSNSTNVSGAVVRVIDSTGTMIEGPTVATSDGTYYTNSVDEPRIAPLTLYTLPLKTTAWTTAELNSTELGLRLAVDGGTNTFIVSTMWLTVEYDDSFSMSGTCHAFDQTTACGDTGSIRYAVNGVLQFAAQDTVAGSWTISGIEEPSTDDIITTFIDGASDTDEAVNVSKYTGSGVLAGIKLYKEHLVIGNAATQTLTNTNLGQYDNSVSSDEDIFHDVSSGALTVDSTAQSSTEELYIIEGNTYQPGGTVATHDIEIDGTFTAEANAVSVSGSWNNDSNFSSSGTVTFTATSGTESIDSTGSSTNSFSALTLGSGSGTATWNLGSALDINGALTINFGTLAQNGAHNITTAGNVAIAAGGNYTKSTGTWTFDGITATTLSNAATVDNLGNVTFNKTDTVAPATNNKVTLSSSVQMDTVTINGTGGQADTLDLGSSGYTLDLANSGATATVLTVSGTLTPGTSTVKYSATNSGGNVNITTTTYSSLQFSGTETYDLTGNLTSANAPTGNITIDSGAILDATATPYNTTLAGTFTISGGGTYTARGSTVRIAGSYANAGTLTAGTSTFILTGSSGTKTINSSGASAASFNNLTLGETSGTATFNLSSSLDVNGDLNITYGTLSQNGTNAITTAGNVTIGANGNYTKSTGTWTFDGTTAATLTNASVADNLGTVILNKTDTVAPSTNNKLTTTTNTVYETLTINGTGGQADTFVAGDNIYLLSAGSTADVLVVAGTIDLQTNNVTVVFEASNSGGNVNVPTIPYHSVSFDGDTYVLTGDLTGANDVEGDITINAATLDVTTAPYDIELIGNWSNNGTFVPRTGGFYIVGSGTSIISGTTTFSNFTSSAAGKIIKFQKHTANSPYFTFENDFSMTGALGNEIVIQSDTNGSQWLAKFDSSMVGSTYVDVQDSGCYTATNTITFDATSNSISGNDLSCWLFGSLTTDIVDAGGSPVASPSVAMATKAYQFLYQTSTATLGTASEKIRVTNSTASPTWNLTIAASTAPTDFWDGSTADYDFNDPTASAGDGGDADSLGGQLSINPTAGTVTPEGGCSSTGITKGSSTAFNQGATDEITLLTAGGSADTGCYWDFIDIALSQTIPAQQNATTYNIDMTLTVL